MLEFKGIPKETFYSKIGMTSASFRGNARKTPLNSTAIENILSEVPDINLRWLITGEGEMLKLGKLTDRPTTAIQQTSTQLGVPLVSIEAAAGFGSRSFCINENDIQERYFVPDFNGIDFMIRVKGSSMYPKYSSGDIIACRILHDSKFIQWNKCHVVATKEQGILVKRLKKGTTENCLIAISDNKEYDPFEIPTDEITGIGLIIGVIRLE